MPRDLLKTDISPMCIARFWSSATRTRKCWDWRLSLGAGGYGQFNTGGQIVRAHRFAYFLTRGVDPGDLLVCHSCDNPRCVNPDHLFVGTCGDNNRDMSWKGRNYRQSGANGTGPKLYRRKLTEDQVRDIRLERAAGISLRKLAAKYDISVPSICAIERRKAWAWVKDDHLTPDEQAVAKRTAS